MARIIKKLCAILVFAGINAFLIYQLYHQLSEFRLTVSPISVQRLPLGNRRFNFAKDVDGDGRHELIFHDTSRHPDQIEYSIANLPAGTPVPTIRYHAAIPRGHQIIDASYNRNLNLYSFQYIMQKGKNLVIKEISQNDSLPPRLITLDVDAMEISGGNFSAGINRIEDLENDGNPEILMSLASGYNRSPRGISCFDYQTGKCLWTYFCGPAIPEIQFGLPGKDGKKKIILSTCAVNNGLVLNGTSDAFSYVIVLDSNGNELWKRLTGKWYTQPISVLADIDNDGNSEIIAALHNHRFDPEIRGSLYILDGLTGEIKAKRLNPVASYSNPFIRFPFQTEPRIYVGDSKGRIHMYDKYLLPLKIKPLDSRKPIKILNSPKVAKDSPYLYVLSSENFTAYTWDLQQKVIETPMSFPSLFKFNLLGGYLLPAGIQEGDYLLTNPYHTYSVREKIVPFHEYLNKFLSSSSMFSIFLLLLFNLLYLFWTLQFSKITVSHPGAEESQVLEQIQEAARQAKNPISTILWTAEKIKRMAENTSETSTPQSYERLTGFLEQDVETLKQQTTHILKLLQTEEKQP